MADKVIVEDLDVRTILGYDSWERDKPQTILITVAIYTSISSAGLSDKVSDSIHYGHTKKRIEAYVAAHPRLKSIEAMAEGVAKTCLEMGDRALAVRVKVKKPRTLLHAKAAGVVIYRTRKDVFGAWPELPAAPGLTEPQLKARHEQHLRDIDAALSPADESSSLVNEDHIFVDGIQLNVIVGVNPWERHYRQKVVLHLRMHVPRHPVTIDEQGVPIDYVPPQNNFRFVVETVASFVEASSFRTVEALSSAVARVAVKQCHVNKITVRVEKPSALMFAACSAVEITRSSEDYGLCPHATSWPGAALSSADRAQRGHTTAYIALGTNLGDRLANLHRALDLLRETNGICVAETSFLYDTAPMYVTDQPAFLNGACKVKTTLSPHQLLKQLKRIEAMMGRDFGAVRNGPRIIDLDILFYGSVHIETADLVIPHPRLHERRFQLAPLCDLNADIVHPGFEVTVSTLLRQLTTHSAVPDDVVQVTPLSRATGQLRPMTPRYQRETLIMGILNCTLDSFSDGGDYLELDKAVQRAREVIEREGAHILDIGGQSTRPGAEQVGAEEEARRVVPVIRRLRAEGISIPISIDTFYASVAEAGLEAGADIINDVTGGHHDPAMLSLAAKTQCPIVLMHMRGTPKTMTALDDYSDVGGDVIRGIRHELSQRVKAALDAGVPRWNIILDPGIGFAKNAAQNFEVLRRLDELVAANLPPCPESDDGNLDLPVVESLATPLRDYPVLVGSSRKRFIGAATGKAEAKSRVWGTAATVATAIQKGAAIVRVHDIAEMVDVAKVTDHIWRTRAQ